MKYVITYNLGRTIPFKYETENAFEMYSAVSEIIKHNKIMYPDQNRTLNEYFVVCANIASGKTSKYETHFFSIERIEPEKSEQK